MPHGSKRLNVKDQIGSLAAFLVSAGQIYGILQPDLSLPIRVADKDQLLRYYYHPMVSIQRVEKPASTNLSPNICHMAECPVVGSSA